MTTPREDPSAAADPSLPDLLEMWTALLACDWHALAIVPADNKSSAQPVLVALEEATRKGAPKVRVLDARGTTVEEGKQLAREAGQTRSGRARVVIVADSITHSLASVHVVQEATVVLLVVRVGGIDEESLAATLSIVGSERVIGTVAVSASHE